MLGKLLASRCLRERGNERLQHERRLPRTRHARHGNEAASRDIDRERLHRMQPARFQVNPSHVEHFPSLCARASHHALRPRKKGAYNRGIVAGNLVNRALRNHRAAVRTCGRSHFHKVVRGTQDTRIVVNHHHGIAVSDQVAHHAQKAVDIGGVQADGGLVHHVEHASGSVPHRTRELHALALPRGKRGARAVEREVSQSQLQQTPSGARKRVADGSRHGAHLIRKTPGHAFHP